MIKKAGLTFIDLILIVALSGLQTAVAGEAAVASSTACFSPAYQKLEAELVPALARRFMSTPGHAAAMAAAYLKANPETKLRIAFPATQALIPGRPLIYSETAEMIYDGSSSELGPQFLINHALLHEDGGDELILSSDAARRETFIDALAPMFVHEARHALHQRDLRLGLDASSELPSFLEDELAAWYAGYLFIADALREDPDYDNLRDHADISRRSNVVCMLSHFATSNSLFEAIITDAYPERLHVNDDAAIEKMSIYYERLEAPIRDYIATGNDPNEADSRKAADKLRRLRAFLKDKRMLAETRRYYSKELGVLRREAARIRKTQPGLLQFASCPP